MWQLAISAQEAAAEQRPVLARHETPFAIAEESAAPPFDPTRFRENGNEYGTPPPQEE